MSERLLGDFRVYFYFALSEIVELRRPKISVFWGCWIVGGHSLRPFNIYKFLAGKLILLSTLN